MNRKFHIAFIFLATVLMTAFLAGCETPEPEEVQGKKLVLSIRIPGNSVPGTKATPALDAESVVRDIQIWAYTHYAPESVAGDAEKPVSHSVLNLGAAAASGEYEAFLFIPDYVFDRTPDKQKLDFYVLVNASSLGLELSSNMTRGQMKDLAFGKSGAGDPYGVTSPVSAVPSGGLPITCFYNNHGEGFDITFLTQDLTEAEIRDHYMPTLTLSRAVSRMRLLFSRNVALTGVSIVSLDVAASCGFPTWNYVFPREDSTVVISVPSASGYEALSLSGTVSSPYLPSNSIGGTLNPTRMRRDSNVVSDGQTKAPSAMTDAEYESFIRTEIVAGALTQKIFYLRETDRQVALRITYDLGSGEAKETTVTLATGDHLYRNHTMTVYAYFQGSPIGFQVDDSWWTTPHNPTHTFN